MNVAISRKRPGLLYALAVALPFTAQAEETVVVTATPPASASAPTEGYSASTSLGATKTDQPLITTAQSVSVVTRQQMADQGRIPSARRWNIPRGSTPASAAAPPGSTPSPCAATTAATSITCSSTACA
ncbi:ferrioxamine receptor [Klebsiella pneumoniae]|uniref:Ferrioxamine receptor n=1 Tax=Klebsiella pneumoniae TaxID=573 RepID=A0A2X1QS89_KLEPN|nr:ferrioxamine receptor [Klebsiella pneumoniae]